MYHPIFTSGGVLITILETVIALFILEFCFYTFRVTRRHCLDVYFKLSIYTSMSIFTEALYSYCFTMPWYNDYKIVFNFDYKIHAI